MHVVELVKLFAEALDVAVVVTDRNLEPPGPIILYANPAFARMSGYALTEVLGASPRMLQGPATNQQTTRTLVRHLRAQGRFRGVLQNYRRSGETYLCEIDVRAIHDAAGTTEAYIAFEREVVRRRGRPSQGSASRYRSLVASPKDALLFLEPSRPDHRSEPKALIG